MDETTEKVSPKVPESPKPLAFTIDFGERKAVDTQRFKNLVEKYQSRHKRGQSLSKFEDSPNSVKKHPLTGNLPRKSSFHSEGYFSSDEKVDRFKYARSTVLNTVISKGDLTLPLKNISSDRMTQSFPSRNFDLPSINSPEIELKDVSSPELDLISPISPLTLTNEAQSSKMKITKQHSSPECATSIIPDEFVCATEFDFEKSDTVSDAGTYTLDGENYTEEQKARMSIDKIFNIEQISHIKKTQEYVQSLNIAQKVEEPVTPVQKNNKIKNIESEPEQNIDQGVFTSITASGVLSKRPERRGHIRRSSLVKSEIFVEAYTGDTSSKQPYENVKIIQTVSKPDRLRDAQKRRSLNLDEIHSSTKIPSPIHSLNRPRSRNSVSSQNLDLSDSSLETESYLKPTQNIISSLQARLSIDSDEDGDRNIILNNETKILLKNKPVHVRHNSFDDRNVKISNKLEHFHNKNLQGIDQTFKSSNQYHRIQNSPNNSPIRRSSSFSMKNQPKCLNKDANVCYNSPNFQRSSSTANIKPNLELLRRSSINSDQKSNKPHQFVDSESTSDDDYDKFVQKNKKDLTATRYNRAFSLRRARLDVETPPPKCPNTPEMRRKFASNEKSERTVSVDRKSAIQSRYMNITKNVKTPAKPIEPPKVIAKPPKQVSSKPPVFSRTDTGRFSMRTSKPSSSAPKPPRREQQNKKQSGPRSNSTLSSREVEFQNWKRRKSYDPMKAAAEGKRKAELARKQNQSVMTQSYNESQDCDSSPSHSSSVHRSQSFHGTAALEQLVSSEEDDDLTLSGDEGFSPPTPSPCDSPSKSNLRHIWMDRFTSKR